jgi:hypothetical protein
MPESSSPPSSQESIPGLPDEASASILALLRAEPAVHEVWLYGSRAMGRHRPGSDIDLTLVAPHLTHNDRLRLMTALDDLLLPWSACGPGGTPPGSLGWIPPPYHRR